MFDRVLQNVFFLLCGMIIYPWSFEVRLALVTCFCKWKWYMSFWVDTWRIIGGSLMLPIFPSVTRPAKFQIWAALSKMKRVWDDMQPNFSWHRCKAQSRNKTEILGSFLTLVKVSRNWCCKLNASAHAAMGIQWFFLKLITEGPYFCIRCSLNNVRHTPERICKVKVIPSICYL